MMGYVIKTDEDGHTFTLTQGLPEYMGTAFMRCILKGDVREGKKLIKPLFAPQSSYVIHTDELPPLLSLVSFNPIPRKTPSGELILYAKDVRVDYEIAVIFASASVTAYSVRRFFKKCVDLLRLRQKTS